jgi:hypothetical protein
MKTFLVSFLVLMGSSLTSFQTAAQSIPAPPCRQVDLNIDTTKRRILDNFITACSRDNYFVHDKGIILLEIYTNAKGLTNWILTPRINDSYKDNPTPTFAVFNDYIILVYRADVNGRVETTTEPAPVNKCLEDIIGDRVYLRPTRRDRWVPPYKMLGTDRISTQGRRGDTTGGGGAIHVLFYKNGTYKITPMV